jgi:hypothetical protein
MQTVRKAVPGIAKVHANIIAGKGTTAAQQFNKPTLGLKKKGQVVAAVNPAGKVYVPPSAAPVAPIPSAPASSTPPTPASPNQVTPQAQSTPPPANSGVQNTMGVTDDKRLHTEFPVIDDPNWSTPMEHANTPSTAQRILPKFTEEELTGMDEKSVKKELGRRLGRNIKNEVVRALPVSSGVKKHLYRIGGKIDLPYLKQLKQQGEESFRGNRPMIDPAEWSAELNYRMPF